jgi:hypothetical protein
MSRLSPTLECNGGQRLPGVAAREMLLVVGSLLAVVLGPLFFVMELAIEGFGTKGLTAAVVNVVIGLLMLLSVGLIRRGVANGIPLAIISAIILIVLGGMAGFIGGLFGLVGALLVLASRMGIFPR